MSNKYRGFSNIRKLQEQDRDEARKDWKAVAEERLKLEQQGDSFNPWLAVKQAWNNAAARIPESAMAGGDFFTGSPDTEARNKAFDESLEAIRNNPKSPLWKKDPY